MGCNPQGLDDEGIAYNELVSNLPELKHVKLKLQTQLATSISPELSTNIILAFQEQKHCNHIFHELKLFCSCYTV
jgi:hypothetical protein